MLSTDPLSVPPRREQCSRKAKQSSMHAMLMNSSSVVGDGGVVGEPDEFTDSDTDPVWTPQEEDVSFSPPVSKTIVSQPAYHSSHAER